jgi:hypothetical protein
MNFVLWIFRLGQTIPPAAQFSLLCSIPTLRFMCKVTLMVLLGKVRVAMLFHAV